MNGSFSWEKFNRIPVVGILRNVPAQQMEPLARNYLKAGLTTLEITMNSEGVVETIDTLIKSFGDELNIGAGTVCTLDDLNKALSAGAQFIVTPIINEDVIKECMINDIPVFAGAYTPTEIYKAWSLGASMVKVFPAGKLGPGYIRDVLAPLDSIKLMPTGGVTLDNFTEYLKAGAKGVGLGSQLIKKDLLLNEKWEELSMHMSAFVKKYEEFKNMKIQ
jgi:2-dehydro-3-deoxyphosphogluconate aldolase/(4S)-4-hydroxy-2-oxoglutarate aldolase